MLDLDLHCRPFKPSSMWMDLPWAITATETTGFDPKKDRVVELTVLQASGGMITEKWHSLVNPQMEIPLSSEVIHKISTSMVSDSPRFVDVVPDLREATADRVQVAYNGLGFDYPLIRGEYHFAQEVYPFLPILDPLVWVRKVDRKVKGRGRYRLDVTLGRWGIPRDLTHRGSGNAMALMMLMKRLEEYLPPTLGQVLEEQDVLQKAYQKNLAAWKAKQARRERAR